MNMRTARKPGLAKWIAVLVALIAFALVPSKACACLETYQISPVRLVLSTPLLLVFAVVALSLPGRRAVWGGGACLVALVSSAVALAVGSHSLAFAASVLVVPLLAMALFAAWQRLRARRSASGAV